MRELDKSNDNEAGWRKDKCLQKDIGHVTSKKRRLKLIRKMVTLGEPSLISIKGGVRGTARRINIQYRWSSPNAEGTMIVPPAISRIAKWVVLRSGPNFVFPVGRSSEERATRTWWSCLISSVLDPHVTPVLWIFFVKSLS